MKTDLRGFSYSLEPIRRKYQWQLDILHGKLGRIQSEIEHQQELLAVLKEEYQAVAKKTAETLLLRIDPSLHRHALDYLGQLSVRIQENKSALSALLDQRNDLREACISQQKKLELTDQHRASCLKDFIGEAQNRQNTEADRDWNAREFWRGRALINRPHLRESRRKGTA